MSKIIVFSKNSPWGIKKVPMKGNTYTHVPHFVDKNGNFSQPLKDKMINKLLCDDGKTLTQMLADAPEGHPYEPQDEISFNFYTTPDWQKNRMTLSQISLSDTCVKEEDGVLTFYTLSLKKLDKQQAFFDVELDIYLTYHIKFRVGTTNNVIQAHMDRWNKNSKKPLTNYMMNQEPELNVEPALHEKENVNWKLNSKMNPATKALWKKIKWMVVYLKDKSTLAVERSEYTVNAQVRKKSSSRCSITGSSTGRAPRICKLSDYEVVPGTGTKTYVSKSKITITGGDGNGSKMSYNNEALQLPYQILIVPMLVGYNISYNSFKFSPNYFQAFFNDDEQIISVHLLDSMPFRFDNYQSITSINLDGNELKMVGTARQTPDSRGYHFNTNGFFVIDNINLFGMSDVEQSAEITIRGQTPILPTNNIIPVRSYDNEPKLWFQQFYNVSIKTWNGEDKVYYPFWMSTYNNKWQLRKVYTCQPEFMSELVWFHGIDKNDNLHMGNILNHKIVQEIPTKQLASIKHMRENKNQLATGVKYDKQTRAFSWVAAAMTLPALNPVATSGAVYSAIQSQKSLEMRESKLKDIQNFIPNVDASNNLMMNQYFNQINREGIVVTHNYLLDEHRAVVYDNFYNYGYTVKRVLDLNDVISSRYIFNYVRATDVFNTIENKLSPLIKEKISTSFEEGITFWHYRDENTWGGFLNHSKENWEMSMLIKLGKV